MNSNDHKPMEHWPGEDNSDSQAYDTNGKLTVFALVTLITIGIILAFSYLYDRYSRSNGIRPNRRPTMFFFATDPSAPASVTASRGLDPAVLRTLPVFAFSDATHKDPIGCAVCLSEFEEGEAGRVLPSCKHAFHVECIDMWFHSHSTCPLCRALVEPPPATTMEEERVTVITISPEPVTSSGSGSSAIEIPRRGLTEFEDDLTRDIPANHSPMMNRMLLFTRMLSRNRRSAAPSSFAGAQSPSPSSRCRIVMNESDIEAGERRD
ncbi:hypothetical protein Bca101_062576 [Brassica carinata]